MARTTVWASSHSRKAPTLSISMATGVSHKAARSTPSMPEKPKTNCRSTALMSM